MILTHGGALPNLPLLLAVDAGLMAVRDLDIAALSSLAWLKPRLISLFRSEINAAQSLKCEQVRENLLRARRHRAAILPSLFMVLRMNLFGASTVVLDGTAAPSDLVGEALRRTAAGNPSVDAVSAPIPSGPRFADRRVPALAAAERLLAGTPL